jgi:hypothetical protein
MASDDVPRMTHPDGRLEQILIDDFLRARGIDSAALQRLPPDEAKRLLTEASTYASEKLAEVEARAHYVHDIHSER